MTSRSIWLLTAIVAVGSPALAVKLEYKFKAGERIFYHDQLAMAFDSDSPQSDERLRLQLRSDSRIKEVVKKVDHGVYTIELETVENKTERTTPDGETHKSENTGHPERIRLSSSGKVLERVSLDKDEDSGPSMGFVSILDEFGIVQQVFDATAWPEEDIEPGHEWTTSLSVDLTPDDDKVHTPVQVDIKSVFRRLVVVRGETCAELVSDFAIPYQTPKTKEAKELNVTVDGLLQGHLVTYFSIERGRSIVETATLGAVATMKMAPPGGRTLSTHGRLKINIKTVLEP